jgi:CubicO group peptidase (beta-lactamase class C family)
VLDIWAGHIDADRTQLWQRDTIVNLYSVGKAITALCLLQQVELGRIDLDTPVAHYWPEFAQAGKERIPVRQLLTHEAGLPAVRKALPPGSSLDWDLFCAALAEQEPWWEPGSTHGYHTNTFGYLVGEVLRRVTGLSVGTYLRDELCGPGQIDFHIGFGPELDHRVADVLPAAPREEGGDLPEPSEMQKKANLNPPGLAGQDIVNQRSWRAAEVPATNGHGNARALARLYGALAGDGELDGLHILAPAWIERASAEAVYGNDAMLGRVTRFGLGFQLTMEKRPLGPNPRTFGHFGAGGSLGFADPDAGLGFGYAMNRGRAGWQHRHVRNLIDLIYEAL